MVRSQEKKEREKEMGSVRFQIVARFRRLRLRGKQERKNERKKERTKERKKRKKRKKERKKEKKERKKERKKFGAHNLKCI